MTCLPCHNTQAKIYKILYYIFYILELDYILKDLVKVRYEVSEEVRDMK